MKNILIIINKSWEVEPLLSAMTAMKIKPVGFPYPSKLNTPIPQPLDSSKSGKQDKCRAIFEITQKDPVNQVETLIVKATVWCIEDIMDPAINSSSSGEKASKLPMVFNGEQNVDLVIAFGTAAFNDKDASFNGSLVIGSEFFTYNAHDDNAESQFKHPLLGKYLKCNLSEDRRKSIFKIIDDKFKDVVESKLVLTPNEQAKKTKVLAASNYVAISNINITDPNDFAWADEAGINDYTKTGEKSPIGSIETTHGVIRLASELPIIFVSAITDRLTRFASEVTPSQNYIASFNGGILLSHLIPALGSIK